MIVHQTSIFKRQVKKMHKSEKVALDKVVKQIISNPAIGEMKIGDLAGIQVFKYKHNSQLYLVAYQYRDEQLILTLINHGTHENFYRDLKKH
ncbi:MAG: addiction module toxin RelE [Gammaproteobacteria bacterium]|nr:MAG: addiction module toxin RelE [Gammaproteobacteria bacterium]